MREEYGGGPTEAEVEGLRETLWRMDECRQLIHDVMNKNHHPWDDGNPWPAAILCLLSLINDEEHKVSSITFNDVTRGGKKKDTLVLTPSRVLWQGAVGHNDGGTTTTSSTDFDMSSLLSLPWGEENASSDAPPPGSSSSPNVSDGWC